MDDIAEKMETIVMDRYTQFKANFPAIREPRWRDQKILINADVGEHNKIVCIYQRADGTRMFPEPLYVSKRTALRHKPFEMTTAAGGVIKMRAIPINEFKILKVSDRSLLDIL